MAYGWDLLMAPLYLDLAQKLFVIVCGGSVPAECPPGMTLVCL